MTETPEDPKKSDPQESSRGSAGEDASFPESGPHSEPTLSIGDAYSRETGVHTFAPDTLLTGRYRVVRFIAAGGMGEVYEAFDQELDVRVALKTLKRSLAGDDKILRRFRQEIALARQVTHPNVCRIFDVAWHHEEGAQSPGVAFLTMEYLPGETLHDRIARTGALPPEESEDLLRQVAGGLAAAHRAGIIHRDLKSANVMLVPEASGLRAVVTDFGLARPGSDAGLTRPGEIAGTPAYMAPEQLHGGSVSPATDVYAFGVVLCETLTGRKPFEGDATLASALDRLHGEASQPSFVGRHAGKNWEPILHRCLEREPSRRYRDGADLLAAIDGVTRPRGKRRLLAWGAAAAMALLLVAGFAMLRSRSSAALGQIDGTGKPPPHRASVAVLGFRNLSGGGESAWLSTALAEMLSTELAAGERLRTIPGETVSRTKRDLGLGETESLAADSLARVRTSLGADYVVMGSYITLPGPSGGTLRFDVRLQDAAAGETLASFSETGDQARLFDLAAQAGKALREKLGVAPASPAESAEAQAMVPSSPEAARLYAEGLDRMRLLDTRQALRFFQEAAAKEPGHPLIHAGLAWAWTNLGYDGKALDEAKKAYELSSSLPREGRLVVEGRYRAVAGQWSQAVDCCRALWGFFPDNLEYGLMLANVQSKGGQGRDALATVGALRRMPGPASQDPRIDLAESEAAQSLAEWKSMEDAADRAAERSQARGSRGLLAQALLQKARALRKLGDAKGAEVQAKAAQAAFEAVGDREGAAHAQSVILFLMASKGDLAEAKALGAKLLAVYRDLGNQRGTAMILNALANMAYDQNDLKAARAAYEEGLVAVNEMGDRGSAARLMGNLANVLLLQGDVEGAFRRQEEALALSREVGDRSGTAYQLCALGEIQIERGDPRAARSRYEESIQNFRAVGEKSGEAYALFGLSDVQKEQADLTAARTSQSQALSLRQATGETGAADESRLSLAGLDLEEGKAAQAEAAAHELLKAFETANASGDAALAWDLAARASLAQGRPADALQAAVRAASLAGEGEDKNLLLIAALTLGRAKAAAGDHAGADKALGDALREAGNMGRADMVLKAKLAVGEAKLSGPKRAEALQSLAAVEREAESRGFVLIANKAKAFQGR